jgi:LuxR family transcriptional regulator, maltose regulon positive regulatory protein
MSGTTIDSSQDRPADGLAGAHPSPVRWDELEQQVLGVRPLGSRLRPPLAQVPLVHREMLVASLLQERRPLVVLTAPAGYGKSTALAQWLAQDPRPSAWLQLDEADNDPVVLLAYLCLALGQVAPLDPAVLDLLRLRTPPVDERIVPAMAAAMEAAEPFLLVLDDSHLLGSAECWRLLGVLLAELPPGAQVAVGTRADPPLPLGRLRAADRLADYDLADLALDRRETRELLRLHDITVDPAAIDELLAVTEGWAAGLRLALLAGQGRPAEDWLLNVRGDQHAIAAYLAEEVLDRQPAELRHFLLRTSILDRLSPSLCHAVTGDDQAAEHLATLVRENLFVTAMDDRDEWYRYHHLFADLLAALARRRAPDELPGLHRRAAGWYEEHGDGERAVRHWLAAGDVAAAAWPAFCASYDLAVRGQVEGARRVLDSFTDEQLSEHIALTMGAGWLYGTIIGDPAKGERWRRAACTVPTDDELMPNGEATWRGYQAGLRSLLAPDGVTRMLADAQLSLDCQRRFGRDTAEPLRVLGVAEYLCGHPKRAAAHFRDVAAMHEADCMSYALAFLSLIAADEERWDDAARLDAEALALTPSMTLDLSPGMYLAMPMLLAHARVLARSGAPEAAAAIARSERYLGDMVPQVPWRLVLIQVVLGEAQLLRGEIAEAERWARRAEATIVTFPDPGMLRGRTRRLREALEERRLADPLTAAERRVLDLLPTQLTATQMAARLFVSQNTVKTHLKSIYAKLGVKTRTDAVERSRELGLLSPDGNG